MPALPAIDFDSPRNCRRAGIGMSVLFWLFRRMRKKVTNKH